jgi:hypothetical protein
MAAFAGDGQTLRGDQLQPEVMLMLDMIEGKASVNLRELPHHRAECLRRMLQEYENHVAERLPKP